MPRTYAVAEDLPGSEKWKRMDLGGVAMLVAGLILFILYVYIPLCRHQVSSAKELTLQIIHTSTYQGMGSANLHRTIRHLNLPRWRFPSLRSLPTPRIRSTPP